VFKQSQLGAAASNQRTRQRVEVWRPRRTLLDRLLEADSIEPSFNCQHAEVPWDALRQTFR
jgi:hypothetical protein